MAKNNDKREQMKEGKGREKEKKKKKKKKKKNKRTRTRTRTTRRPRTPNKAKKKESKKEKEKEKGQQKGFRKKGFWQRKRAKIASNSRKNGVLGVIRSQRTTTFEAGLAI